VRRSKKEELVEKFRDDFQEAQSIVLTNHTGMEVNTVNELRSEFRANDIHYHVVKNTLARIAVEDTEVANLAEQFRYPTAVAYSFEDAVKPAELALEFEEEHEQYEVKCGYIRGDVLDHEAVEQLAEMPSREESMTRIINLLRTSGRQLIQTLHAPAQKFIRLLRSIEEDGGA
jgi:large subunit ribosomal protein L10